MTLVEITAEDLHEAADLAASFGDDETRIEKYGLTVAAVMEFVDGSHWSDGHLGGPPRDMDPFALAIGITIGVLAAQRAHVPPRSLKFKPPAGYGSVAR